eukprot:scaffold243536_cov33-Prasinocladus_malaysianus.AAC.1
MTADGHNIIKGEARGMRLARMNISLTIWKYCNGLDVELVHAAVVHHSISVSWRTDMSLNTVSSRRVVNLPNDRVDAGCRLAAAQLKQRGSRQNAAPKMMVLRQTLQAAQVEKRLRVCHTGQVGLDLSDAIAEAP